MKINQEVINKDWREATEQEQILATILDNLQKLSNYGDIPLDILRLDILRYQVFVGNAREFKAKLSRYCTENGLKHP